MSSVTENYQLETSRWSTGRNVLIRTAEPPEATTSAAAGALWGPWLVEPRGRVLRWAEYTLRVLQDLAQQPDTGVRIATGIEISNTQHEPTDWAHLLDNRRPCRQEELPPGYRYGTRFSAPLVDMPIHLNYLVRRFEAAGGEIHIDPVANLAVDASVVVNCSGIGARTLAPDESLYPIRGQHVVVTNPGLTDFIEADTGDSTDLIAIYPHGDHVVLGGTAEPERWNRDPDPTTAKAVLDRCAKIEPRLHDAEVIEHRVGLRPTRPTVRLDVEQNDNHLVVHNYGHGGAGVSLAWGCASETVERSTDHPRMPPP